MQNVSAYEKFLLHIPPPSKKMINTSVSFKKINVAQECIKWLPLLHSNGLSIIQNQRMNMHLTEI
jgi:hypothetical protein